MPDRVVLRLLKLKFHIFNKTGLAHLSFKYEVILIPYLLLELKIVVVPPRNNGVSSQMYLILLNSMSRRQF